MPREFHAADFPLEPCQFGGNAGLQRSEQSGEIFCPRKMAHIGIMRCGEYQEREDCGDGCTAKAAAEDIARLRAERLIVDGDKGGKRSWVCRRCGGPKAWFYSEVCSGCRTINSRGPYQIPQGRGW